VPTSLEMQYGSKAEETISFPCALCDDMKDGLGWWVSRGAVRCAQT
jgi:hypothetical protein